MKAVWFDKQVLHQRATKRSAIAELRSILSALQADKNIARAHCYFILFAIFATITTEKI